MRMPKFRAWDKLRKIMLPVGDIDTSYKLVYLEEDNGYRCEMDFDEIELMQSTGLKDKKGKEIYEGDIVKLSDCDDDVYVTPVVWDKNYACFGVSFSGKYPISFDYLEEFYTELKDIEVVGNIYENPELLGGE
ncbi:YopX family protein [Streptococcus infantarius]|uniref:YopX family protein n=1 Tax=Streptococcus infantarius TaxID=102684 RepID=UPI003C1E686C